MSVDFTQMEQMELSDTDFETIVCLIKELTGISLTSGKRAMVSGRMSKYLRQEKPTSLSEHLEWLKDAAGQDERDRFISMLTTNTTHFGREAHHFEYLAQKVLPELTARATRGARIRLWSAACSTGEEAYDLASLVLEACPEAPSLDVKILATDIDKTALTTARTGLYPSSHVAKLSDAQARMLFGSSTASGGRIRVRPELQKLISFRPLNLHADWPFRGDFDVIMCRNAAIYFDEEVQAVLWRRLAERVKEDGMLFIGHSESLPECLLKEFSIEGTGTFRRPSGGPIKTLHLPTNITPEEIHK